jgi:hypothetical protein
MMDLRQLTAQACQITTKGGENRQKWLPVENSLQVRRDDEEVRK